MDGVVSLGDTILQANRIQMRFFFCLTLPTLLPFVLVSYKKEDIRAYAYIFIVYDDINIIITSTTTRSITNTFT